ncbi:MAG: NAD-dependent malic enzyme [Firmicutes bacterium HGW-Firmicutes-13]|nr:MAG: NAD-dependent malic enzyme [Firmicutes bacterium HGW-Firmicutes-13]
MTLKDSALKLHSRNRGKIEITSKVKLQNLEDLSLAYTPGVAEPCKEIHRDVENIYKYTSKGNMVAVITDGSAVLGLGDIGPEAALPVMEGKSILFKKFGGLDAFPVCLNTRDVDTIVETIKLIAAPFGAINLEDISAPRCFAIEERLKREVSIPVFHDDQHGTAIVVTAGLFNAAKVAGKELTDLKVVINGAGAAGTAIIKLLIELGVKRITFCDSLGIIYPGRTEEMNAYKEEIARLTEPELNGNTLADALVGADVFIGVSAAGALTRQMVKSMSKNPIIFALANPIPEIMPQDAWEMGAGIVATGRSDFPNQVNNVLAFPGVLRGAMFVRAADINSEMKISAARTIAGLISDVELSSRNIIPGVFDERVAPSVAASVARAAVETGVAQLNIAPEIIYKKTKQLVNSVILK